MKKLFLFLILFLSPSGYESLYGQAATDQLSITATVLSPLSIQKVSDLQFGEILPGRSKTVIPNNLTSCGKWTITGAALKQISFTVTLSQNLVSGSNNLPITFSSSDCIYSDLSDGASPQYFNMGSSMLKNFSAGGKIFIFIGGTINAASNLQGGTYEGMLTITIDYTGS